MAKYPLGPGPRKAHIDSKTRHPSWSWDDQWNKIIDDPDMIIFASEAQRRLDGGAEA